MHFLSLLVQDFLLSFVCPKERRKEKRAADFDVAAIDSLTRKKRTCSQIEGQMKSSGCSPAHHTW